jgi:hypothetical protein
MSGRDKQAEQNQRQLIQTQTNMAKEQLDHSKQRLGRMDELQAPAIQFAKDIVSGDQTAYNRALSIPMSQLKRSQQATVNNVFDTVREGPVRDYMLARTGRDANAQVADMQTKTFLEGLQTLFGAGGEQGNFGLQQLGAGSRFLEGGVAGNQSLIQNATARKSATMGAIGQAAGLGGQIAAGGMKKPQSPGGATVV